MFGPSVVAPPTVQPTDGGLWTISRSLHSPPSALGSCAVREAGRAPNARFLLREHELHDQLESAPTSRNDVPIPPRACIRNSADRANPRRRLAIHLRGEARRRVPRISTARITKGRRRWTGRAGALAIDLRATALQSV
jgi:hypothetical protein